MNEHAIDWDACIDEAVSALPEKFRAKIENVAILLEDEPNEQVRKEEGLGPHETLLGLYHGIPLDERGEGYGIGATLPDTITIYKLPTLEEADHNVARVPQVIRETIWHEFGHYFGLDEDEVRRREGERFPHDH